MNGNYLLHSQLQNAHYQPSQHSAEAQKDRRLDIPITQEHIGKISDVMDQWQGPISDQLGLTQPDVKSIRTAHPYELNLQVRAALKTWKDRNGAAKATYANLIQTFTGAGFVLYADRVRELCYEHPRETLSDKPHPREQKEKAGERTEADSGHGEDKSQKEYPCEVASYVYESLVSASKSSISGSADTASAYALTQYVWERKVLRVMFMNFPKNCSYGSGSMNVGNIIEWANRWGRNGQEVIPEFVHEKEEDRSDIRVEFITQGGSWSYIGNTAEDHPRKTTMQLNLTTGGDTYKMHTVIHEFGHALGLFHEHQRSDFWDKIEKYINVQAIKDQHGEDFYNDNWKRDTTYFPIAKRTKYDPESVMHYPIEGEWILPITPTPDVAIILTALRRRDKYPIKPSNLDIELLKSLYGPGEPVVQPVPQPVVQPVTQPQPGALQVIGEAHPSTTDQHGHDLSRIMFSQSLCPEDLVKWLSHELEGKGLKLDKLRADSLIENKINGLAFLDLTKEELKELGFQMGEYKTIMNVIESLKK